MNNKFEPKAKKPTRKKPWKLPIATNISPRKYELMEKKAKELNINKAQLLRQMVDYCLKDMGLI